MVLKYLCLWFTLLGFSRASDGVELNITGSEFEQGVGWKVHCRWRFADGDTLQSFRMYNNNQQFFIYRPEVRSLSRSQNETIRSSGSMIILYTKCQQALTMGECVTTITPLESLIQNLTFACEVSGERPFFRMSKKSYIFHPFVAPSAATIVSHERLDNETSNELVQKNESTLSVRGSFNCSSTGLPPPVLKWTVANQRMTPDFTGSAWNQTSKLWHTWSFLSVVASEDPVNVTCTPMVEMLVGPSSHYTLKLALRSAGINTVTNTRLLLATITVSRLLRRTSFI